MPVRKTYTCDPDEFGYIDQPQNKLRVPMHYVLKNDKAASSGRRPAAIRQGAHLHRRGRQAKEKSTAFLGEDWGKFTPIDDEMRLYLGVAQDIVVKRTIDKNEQPARRRQPVQSARGGEIRDRELQGPGGRRSTWWRTAACPQRSPRRHRPRRGMGTGQRHQLRRRPDKEQSTFEQLVFHVKLPARGETARREVHSEADVTFKNEW